MKKYLIWLWLLCGVAAAQTQQIGRKDGTVQVLGKMVVDTTFRLPLDTLHGAAGTLAYKDGIIYYNAGAAWVSIGQAITFPQTTVPYVSASPTGPLISNINNFRFDGNTLTLGDSSQQAIANALNIRGGLNIVTDGNNNDFRGILESKFNSATAIYPNVSPTVPGIGFRFGHGTSTSPQGVSRGERLGNITFGGYNSSGVLATVRQGNTPPTVSNVLSEIVSFTQADITPSYNPTALAFYTAKDTVGRYNAMTIDSSQRVLIATGFNDFDTTGPLPHRFAQRNPKLLDNTSKLQVGDGNGNGNANFGDTVRMRQSWVSQKSVVALPDPNRLFPYSQYVASGNSITAGLAASLADATYVRLLGTHLNLQPVNLGVAGDQAADQQVRVYQQNVNNLQLFTLMIGANDITNYGSNVDKQTNFAGFSAALAAWMALPNANKVIGQAATRTGTWTNSSFYGGAVSAMSVTNGDQISFIVNGTTAYLAYTMMDSNGGTFSLTLDGVSQGSYSNTGTNGATILTLNGQAYGSYLLRFTGLSAGNHTFIATVTSASSASNRVIIDWAGGNNVNTTGLPTLLWADIPFRFSTNNLDTYNGLIATNITNLIADGLKVIHVPTAYVLDTATMISADGSHPNNLGYSTLYNTFRKPVDSLNNVTTTARMNNIEVDLGSNFSSAKLGSELTSATGWTGTGWTGTYSDGFYHTNGGGTTALTYPITVEQGAAYRVSFGVNSGFTGNVTASFGGATYYPVTSQGIYVFAPFATTTGTITFTPSNDFSGRIKGISVRKIIDELPSYVNVYGNDSIISHQEKTVAGANSYASGVGAGAYMLPDAYYNYLQGYGADYFLTSGKHNIAIGAQALYKNQYGDSNIAIGNRAGYGNDTSDIVTSSNNLLLGPFTGRPIRPSWSLGGFSIKNLIYGIETVRGVGGQAGSGFVGIGTRAPVSTLHLYSSGAAITTEESGNGTSGHIENIIGGSSAFKRWQNNGTTIATMLNTGALNIGSSATPIGMFNMTDNSSTPTSSWYSSANSKFTSLFGGTVPAQYDFGLAAGTSATTTNILSIKRSRGTLNSPSTVSTGDYVSRFIFSAHDGTNFLATAGIDALVTGTVGTASINQALIFLTTSGGNSRAEKWRIDATGNLSNTGADGTAYVTLKAGTTSLAPLRLTSGTDLTSVIAGTFEYNGTRLAFNPSTTRKRVVLSNDAAPANGQIPIGNGTDYTVANITQGNGISITNGAGSITIAQNTTVQPLTDGATITWNIANGSNAFVTLGGNRTLAITNTVTGYGTLKVTQDATGNRTLTLPANSKVIAFWGSGTTINLSTSPNAIDILNFYYDGTNYYWTLGKNYQ